MTGARLSADDHAKGVHDCSHCIGTLKAAGDRWVHFDDDPTCLDFWHSTAEHSEECGCGIPYGGAPR